MKKIRLVVLSPKDKITKVLVEAEESALPVLLTVRDSLNSEPKVLGNANKGYRVALLDENGIDGPWSEAEL